MRKIIIDESDQQIVTDADGVPLVFEYQHEAEAFIKDSLIEMSGAEFLILEIKLRVTTRLVPEVHTQLYPENLFGVADKPDEQAA